MKHDLNHYCVRCDSDRGTHGDRGREWCNICWKRRKPLPAWVIELAHDHEECKSLGLIGWRDRALAAEKLMNEIKEAAIKYGVNDEVGAAIAHAALVQRVAQA